MNKSTCPICHSETNFFFKYYNAKFKKTFQYFQCKKCDHISIDKVLSQQELFQDYDYEALVSNEDGNPTSLIERILDHPLYVNFFSSKKFVLQMINCFNKQFHRSPRSYLDYGCGISPNLSYFKNIVKEANCLGYEESLHARSNSNSAIVNDLSVIKKHRFEVISLFHVIEHLPDPVETLKFLKKISDKNTLLVLQFPQAHALDLMLRKLIEPEFILHNPYHINFFSSSSIKLALRQAGFRPLKLSYEIYQTHSLVYNQSDVVKLAMSPFLIGLSFLIHPLKLSPVMTVYASHET